MKNHARAVVVLVAALGVLPISLYPSPARAQTPSANIPHKEKVVTTRASGTFDVKLNAQATEGYAEDGTLGRMTIDKQFHGELDGTSKGQMLTAMSSVKGSAGYVAIERVTGKLHGRSGSFALQHSGTMNRNAPTLIITVVPDSGTGELVGLSGTMVIDIADGKHSYVFEYAIAGGR